MNAGRETPTSWPCSDRERPVSAARGKKKAPEFPGLEGSSSIAAQGSRTSRNTDVAQQLEWHGLRLTPDDWKLIFLDALKQEVRIVPNIDGTGFVNLGRSSSDLSKGEMSDLIEIIHAFGARHGVKFMDPQSEAA